MKPSDTKLHALVARLADLQKRAKALGVFTGDRELLECPRCGLLEDVTCTGLLITCHAPALGEDTGLRFEEIKGGKFRCPECNGLVTETPEKPTTKTRSAKRKFCK